MPTPEQPPRGDALRRWLPFLLFTSACAVAAAFLSACGTLDQTQMAPPSVPGAVYVGNDACAECHQAIHQAFPGSPHAQFHRDDAPGSGLTGCESCHGPGSLHVAAGGGRYGNIVNPGKDPTACFNCHLDVHAEFQLPHAHPVVEGRMGCADCHDPHGADIMKPASALAFARVSQSCAQCHREQTKPTIYEHEAMREGCVVCHTPHGSFNEKLLTERDANLCLKCHAHVQGAGVNPGELYIGKSNHSFYLSQGSCWSAGCHQGVHGSNIHPQFRYR